MNPLNYATLEASQRLHANGIVLETEMVWFSEFPKDEWGLITASAYNLLLERMPHMVFSSIPAPSMPEVWRELPEMIGETGRKFYLTAQRLGGFTEVGYESAHHDGVKKSFESTNPTDALVDLLIWVVEQRKEEGK
jgi:hypothetical protein